MSNTEVSFAATAADRLMTALEEQEAFDAMKKAEEEQVIRDTDTLTLIQELYRRGVKISDVFGRYYEFDEAGFAKRTRLTVDDALLAGFDGKPVEEVDF